MSRTSTLTLAYAVRTVAAWGVALLLFFPLGWLLLTAFKTELQALSLIHI
jgi:sorbitol/mannitol transport system permease protein